MANLNFENIQIQPAVFQWGQQNMTKFVLKSIIGIGGKHFLIAKPTQEYYVWFDDGSASDPAVAGKTGIAVTMPASPTISTTMAALVTALTTAGFNVKSYVEAGVTYCYIQNKDMGTVVASAIGSLTSALAEVTTVRNGFLLDLGLSEDVEISFSTSLLDVKASQFGTTVLERLRNGMNIESISINLKEVIAEKIKTIMKPHYPSYTPSVAGATEVQGIGNSKDFLNVSADSGKLVIHPMKLPATNLAEDFAFWRACPLLSKLNFSGESEQVMSVEFSILPDYLLAKEVAHGVFGDHTQNFLK
jgi:hypothetical protein